MKNVLVPLPGEDWIVDRIASEFIDNTKHHIVNYNHYSNDEEDYTEEKSYENCDVIMLFASFTWKRIIKHYLETKRFIVMQHHCVPQKFDLQDFSERDTFVDAYIVPNKHTETFIKQYTSKPIYKINYWINKELWQQTNRNETRKLLRLEDKFVVFSAIRDTEGAGCDGPIPQPKIEKNPEGFVKAIKLVRKEIDNMHILLAGWRRQYIIKRLKEENIDFTYIERPGLDVINKLYDASDLCIQSSIYEGGSQQLLEASFKHIPIISTDCGMASEILSENCMFDVATRFYLPTQEDVEYAHQQVLKKCDMQQQIQKIDTIIESYI